MLVNIAAGRSLVCGTGHLGAWPGQEHTHSQHMRTQRGKTRLEDLHSNIWRAWRWQLGIALSVLVLGLGLDLAAHPALRTGAASPPGARLAFELFDGRILEQSFLAAAPALAEIAIVAAVDPPLSDTNRPGSAAATRSRELPPAQASRLVLHLREEGSSAELRIVSIPRAELPAGNVWHFVPARRSSRWTRFRFEPVNSMPGRRYVFTLETSGIPGDSPIRVLLERPGAYPDGRAAIDGAPADVNVLFRTAHRSSFVAALLSRRPAGALSPWPLLLALAGLAGAVRLAVELLRHAWVRTLSRSPAVLGVTRIGAAVLTAAVASIFLLQRAGGSLPWLAAQLAFAESHASWDAAAKLRERWGRTYELAEFVRRETPDDAVVMLPPAPDWGSLGSPFVWQYFLLPRRVAPEQRPLLDQNPPFTHVVVLNQPASGGAPARAWPRFWVPAVRVIHAPIISRIDVAALWIEDESGRRLAAWEEQQQQQDVLVPLMPPVAVAGAGSQHVTPPRVSRDLSAMPPYTRLETMYTESTPAYWGTPVAPLQDLHGAGRVGALVRWPRGQRIALAAGIERPDGGVDVVATGPLGGSDGWETIVFDLPARRLPEHPPDQADPSRVVWVGLDLHPPPALPYHLGWGVIELPRVQMPEAALATHEPRTAYSLLVAGHYRLVRGDAAGALEYYRAARRLAPADPAVLFALAEAARRQGLLTEGLEAAQQALPLAPGEPWAHYARGRILEETGRYADALAAYRRAAELAPGEPWTQLALARLLEAQGAVVAARQHYRLAAAAYPATADAIAAQQALRRLVQ